MNISERVNVGRSIRADIFCKDLQEALAKVPKEFVDTTIVGFETDRDGDVHDVWLEYYRPATEQEKVDMDNKWRHQKLKAYENLKKELGL